MRIHTLLHVPFEDLANVSLWAKEGRHSVSVTRLYEGETPPDPSAFDILFAMGGPMNIYEDDRYAWLKTEKAFLREVVESGKPCVGICLGAQLLADCLGGKVKKNAEKEIGWFPVHLTEEGAALPLFAGFPKEFVPMSWHGDTFALPKGAVNAASSKATPHQAFVYTEKGAKVLGLQFHLEYSEESIEKMLKYSADEIVSGKYIQTAEEIADNREKVQESHRLLRTLLFNIEKQWL